MDPKFFRERGFDVFLFPINLYSFSSRISEGDQFSFSFLCMANTDVFLLVQKFFNKYFFFVFLSQVIANIDYKGSIRYLHYGLVIMGCNFNGSVIFTRCSTSNKKGNSHARFFHFLSIVDHLIQRGCDKPAESKDVRVMFSDRFQNLVTGNHDAKIDNLPVVAGQNYANNVFSNVMHISLHRCDNHGPAFTGSPFCFFCFHVGLKIRNRLFHNPGTFDNLRKKHFPISKQISNDFHSVHQRTFNDF